MHIDRRKKLFVNRYGQNMFLKHYKHNLLISHFFVILETEYNT